MTQTNEITHTVNPLFVIVLALVLVVILIFFTQNTDHFINDINKKITETLSSFAEMWKVE